MLSFLRNTEGVSYIVLTDDGNGGLLAKRGKGRPRAPLSTVGVEQKSAADEVTLPVPSSYCSEQSNLEVSAMRKGMTLSENQKLLLMVFLKASNMYLTSMVSLKKITIISKRLSERAFAS